jgi:putative oxidoreductase
MSTNASPLSKRMAAALALLRVIAGAVFIAHGAQKLFVFGFAGVSGAFGQMGIPLPGLMGPFIALLEFFGGIALVIGLLTRLTSLGLAFDMAGAIVLVHWKAGFFNPAGFEFPLALLGLTGALVLTGAGAFSIDALIAGRRSTRIASPAEQVQRKAA